jgi:putative SOS response-associated peptidase YedK
LSRTIAGHEFRYQTIAATLTGRVLFTTSLSPLGNVTITPVCGRYRLSRRAEVLSSFYAEYQGMDWDARYNIAPTQTVPVITQAANQPTRRASLMRWGLIPSWAKDAAVGAGMINARAETAAEKPAFREPLERRRCLIPADGFYEWKWTGKSRQPYCFELAERRPFAFAGLWDRWRAADGRALETCTILTTTPNQLLADIHDRMPVILAPASHDVWLDPGFQNVSALSAMLRPYDSEMMRRYPVSDRVNSIANDDPECSERFDPLPPAQATLF